jgi:hypothetical protein
MDFASSEIEANVIVYEMKIPVYHNQTKLFGAEPYKRGANTHVTMPE